jgi:hypothetical protein
MLTQVVEVEDQMQLLLDVEGSHLQVEVGKDLQIVLVVQLHLEQLIQVEAVEEQCLLQAQVFQELVVQEL